MRTVKFRAWCRNMQEMIEVTDLHISEKNPWVKDGFGGFTKNFELLQWTGLKDANGIEIYEGDIVRILYTDWPSNPAPNNEGLEEYKKSISNIGEVVYSNLFGDAQYEIAIQDFRGPIAPGPHGEIEVIGNIYENPELLKGA